MRRPRVTPLRIDRHGPAAKLQERELARASGRGDVATVKTIERPSASHEGQSMTYLAAIDAGSCVNARRRRPDPMSPRVHPAGCPRTTIRPSAPHEPPAGAGALASVTGDPPDVAIFFSRPSAKNAIHRPSGEKNGARAPSVPFSRTASTRSIARRTARSSSAERAQADHASVRPSREPAPAPARGDRRTFLLSAQSGIARQAGVREPAAARSATVP